MPKELPVTVNKELSKKEHILGMFPPVAKEKQEKKSKQRKVTMQKIIKQKQDGPARFKVVEQVDPTHVKVYESPDLPQDGKYVLLIKQQDSIVLFPLTQKLGFKMTYSGNPKASLLKEEEVDQAIKNTYDLMKNKKIKVKVPKKGAEDAATKENGAAGKVSKIKDEDDDSKSDSLKDLINDQSDQGDFDDDENSLFQPQAKNLELEKKIEEPLKQGEKPKEPEIPEVDGESKDYSADDGDDDDFF